MHVKRWLRQQYVEINTGGLLVKVIAVAFAGLLAGTVFDHVAYSVTNSLRYNFFIRTAISPKTLPSIKKGDYVSFDTLNPLKRGEYIREIKRVGCTGGDDLRVMGDEYYCGSVYLGKSKPFNSIGQPTNPYAISSELASGQIFVIGDHKDSYDSRYMGLLSVALVKERLWPVW